MTIVTNFYVMDGKLGVDLNFPQTSVTITNDPSIPGPRAKLGDRIQAMDGSEWMFVLASTTVTQYNMVVIDNLFNANNITSALVASNVYTYGIGHFQATQANAGDYFWACMKANGGVGLNVSPSAGRGVALFVSAVAGRVTSSSSLPDQLNGISFVASIGTSASSPGEVVMWSYIMPGLLMAVTSA